MPNAVSLPTHTHPHTHTSMCQFVVVMKTICMRCMRGCFYILIIPLHISFSFVIQKYIQSSSGMRSTITCDTVARWQSGQRMRGCIQHTTTSNGSYSILDDVIFFSASLLLFPVNDINWGYNVFKTCKFPIRRQKRRQNHCARTYYQNYLCTKQPLNGNHLGWWIHTNNDNNDNNDVDNQSGPAISIYICMIFDRRTTKKKGHYPILHIVIIIMK